MKLSRLALAVALLHAYANPDHEERIRELAVRHHPHPFPCEAPPAHPSWWTNPATP